MVQQGVQICYDSPLVDALQTAEGWRLTVGKDQRFDAKFIVTAAGLYSDRVAQMCGGTIEPMIVPVRF